MNAGSRKRIKDKNIIIVAILCFIIGTVSFTYFIYSDGGAFTLRDDFNRQQIPFATALNGLLRNYSGQWCWNMDLGTPIIYGFSFYNLGSPFFWITLLFDKGMFPYVVGAVFILKYVVAGVTAYLYIRIFLKQKRYGIIAALLYAFSGFQSINIVFYHFHDVVAFFPLLLLGLERYMSERRKGLFVFSVFLNCLTNYFFFIGEVVFLLLYYFLRFFQRKEAAMFVKNGIKCLGCGILGVGMAAVLFVPSILYIMGNQRSGAEIYLSALFNDTRNMLLVLKGFLFPVEAMGNQSAVVGGNWNSIACYLPMTGISLVLAYAMKKRDWLAKILLILSLISFLPLLGSVFYLFTHVYHRWWYMFVLMMALASALVLENLKDFPVKKGILLNGVILLMFCGALKFIPWSAETESLILRKHVFLLNFLLSFSGLVAVCLLTWGAKERLWLLTAGISLWCAVTTFTSIYLYRQYAQTGDSYLQQYNLGLQLKELDGQYRYNLSDNQLILPGDAKGIGSFTSTVSNSITEFNMLFGNRRIIFSLDPNEVTGLKELLGARYRVTEEEELGKETVDVIESYGKTYYVIEDVACPIGFAYDSYALEEDFLGLGDNNLKGVAALNNLIISQKDEALVSDFMLRNMELATEYDEEAIAVATDKNIANKVDAFQKDNSGFSCQTNYEEEKGVFFSVPYDAGWSAYIDQEKVTVIKSLGMMAIKVPGGEHTIEFKYSTPGLKSGLCVTALAWIIWIALIICEKKKTGFAKGGNTWWMKKG